jgi:hypothetical protein
MQRGDQHLAFVVKFCTRQKLRKPPDFAPGRDWRRIVEKHRMNKDAIFALEMHRDHLATFGEFAKARCIRQANEFELDDWAGNFERFGHGGPQDLRIGQIFDDEYSRS